MSDDAAQLYAGFSLENVPCPLCGGEEHRVIAEVDRFGMGLRTVLCDECSFVFTNPRPVEAEMEKFYAEQYRRFYFDAPVPAQASPRIHATLAARARFLAKFVAPALREVRGPFRVLDLGCGDGVLLGELAAALPQAERYGVEPDPAYAAQAEGTGATVLNCTIAGASVVAAAARPFKLVVLSHVLEHLYDPVGQLRSVSELQEAGDYLLIEVPNVESPYMYGPGMFHLAHISSFSLLTLTHALSLAGYESLYAFAGRHPADPWAMTLVGQLRPDRAPRSPKRSLDAARLAADLRRRVSATRPNLSLAQRVGLRLQAEVARRGAVGWLARRVGQSLP